MILLNKTLSFAESVQKEGIEWLNQIYIPLLQACPLIKHALLFKIDTQQDADDCFALQITFETVKEYTNFCNSYQDDFDNALLLKFQNKMGVFKTVLRQL